MNKTLITLSLLALSAGSYAQSCPVNVPNDIHIAGDHVSIYQGGQAKLLIDGDNQLFIEGKQVALSEPQTQALQSYSQHIKSYLPQMADLADDGASIAQDIIDELSSHFGESDAFSGAEKLVDEYSEKAKQKFYPEGEFVMPADVFESMGSDWKQEFDDALKHISMESISGIIASLSAEMKSGELNFSDFQTQLSELKKSLQEKIRQRSGEVAEQAGVLCDSIEGLAEEEQELQRVIPEMKDYPMFEI
ncbi:YggN family protein [Photobacterium lutimaris]|uniref:Chemotaxis protein n=1 Tax=Photobacterium lutimaris TaxID=388278 RepID=A0A2T3J1Q8_9GAMM|nr:YggN family protein [Photobacterium lutimaris]PSU35008.1 chemotaxis protein [Photobacterium lutimaris]TDR77365.1 DUF2884 family protein [Photobacterium lutimaris]